MEEQGKYTGQIKKITQEKIERLLTESPWSRAMLAKLRRGIGKQPGELPELFEITLGGLPEEFYSKGLKPSKAEWAIYTALTLFALHQQGKEYPMSTGRQTDEKGSGNSLGAAVAHLVKQERDREPAIKRRFDAVATASEFTELAHHARGMIQLLRARDIPLDYPRFAEDLFWYQFDGTKIQVRLRWGEDYYRIAQSPEEKENGGNDYE